MLRRLLSGLLRQRLLLALRVRLLPLDLGLLDGRVDRNAAPEPLMAAQRAVRGRAGLSIALVEITIWPFRRLLR